MKIIRLAMLAMVVTTLFACHNEIMEKTAETPGSETTSSNKEIARLERLDEKEDFTSDSTNKRQQQRPSVITPETKPDWDKKIIKTATLNEEVKDYGKFYTSLRAKVTSFGGYIAKEDQTESTYKIENSIVIKVPVDQFDNALVQVMADAMKVNNRTVNSEDVSGQLIDTRSRLEAKKQVRLRYLELLKQAHNMADILSVQNEINGIQEEIEAASGRIAALGHSAAFSTINLTYFQVLNVAAIDNDKPGFGERLKDAFGSGWNWISEFSIGMITIWPLIVIIGILIVVYKRRRPSKVKVV